MDRFLCIVNNIELLFLSVAVIMIGYTIFELQELVSMFLEEEKEKFKAMADEEIRKVEKLKKNKISMSQIRKNNIKEL